MFFKIGVLKNFQGTTNNYVGVSFNKIAGLKACNFLKRDSNTDVFAVNIAKFLRTAFL